jgi:hypothetical protein
MRAANTRNERRTGYLRNNITHHFTLLMLLSIRYSRPEDRLIAGNMAAVLRNSQTAEAVHVFGHAAIE